MKTTENMTMFEKLNNLNVNDHVEEKETGKTKLSYLSWAWAWAEVKKLYPDANYTIWKDEKNKPYIFTEGLGYMVYTSVTIDGLTHEMWLPVMDGHNMAMLDESYQVKTKYNSYTVNKASMMDINKAIMRCLTKNLAMFGLGLYIYAGEDLPEVEEVSVQAEKTPQKAKNKAKNDVDEETYNNARTALEKIKVEAFHQYGIDYRDNENHREIIKKISKLSDIENVESYEDVIALTEAFKKAIDIKQKQNAKAKKG